MRSDSPYFQTRFKADPLRAGVWREIVRYLAADMSADGAVLELGPGYCDFINQASGRRKVAVDLDASAREFAAPEVELHIGDCTRLDFLESASIDTVFASNLIEHLDRAQITALLPELRRVLKPGGRLLLIQPNYRLCYANYFDDYTHVSVFSDISLCDLLTAHGFTVHKVIPGLLPFSMKAKVPKHPLLVRLYLRSPIRPLAKQMYVVAGSQQ